MIRVDPPKSCPKCEANAVAEIIYGLVRNPPEGMVLGGCGVDDLSPAWCCKACGHRWGFYADLKRVREGHPPYTEEQSRKLETQRKLKMVQREKMHRLAEERRLAEEVKLTSRRCPQCGKPCPRYRETCRYCGTHVGREL